MEAEEIGSSVITRLVGFDELQQPSQTAATKQRFLSDIYQSGVAMIGNCGEKYVSKQVQEKMRVVSISKSNKREKQINGCVSTGRKKLSSGFLVTPTKELCCAYLKKSTSFASKHVIDARATPPHKREKGMELTGSRIQREKHHSRVNPVKPKISNRDNSLRCFAPISAARGSHLSDRKTGQLLLLENRANESKKLFEKEKYSGEVVANPMVSTCRDLGSSLGQIGGETLVTEVKLRLTSSPRFTSKDENDNSLHCSGTHPKCQTSLEDVNQPSPVSVLEPTFDDGNFGELPHLNFLGLAQQLEFLKSESVETYSEGSGMVVSSDDESDEVLVLDSETRENKYNEPIGSLVVQENQYSSYYTDDVLAEAGLGYKKWVCNQWNSGDLPINPMIFEKLEKKYIDRTAWRRSERRLLFDRINSGLIQISESYIAAPVWMKPVSWRLGTAQSTQGLKIELQKLLAMQDKRAKIPAVDNNEWLELEADIEPVVQELERMLVDELLDELVDCV